MFLLFPRVLCCVSSSNNARTEFHLNRYRSRAEIQAKIRDLVYTRGTTNTAEAIRNAWESMLQPQNGDRDGVRDMLVLVTDGESDDTAQARAQAAEAKSRGIHIITIGIGSWLVTDANLCLPPPPSPKCALPQRRLLDHPEKNHNKNAVQNNYNTFCVKSMLRS